MARLIERDYSGRSDSLLNTFTGQFMNRATGIFYAIPTSNTNAKNESATIYWQQAHALDPIIYAYQRIKNTDAARARFYKQTMQRWYQNHANNWYFKQGDDTGFYNTFTDDMCWICLTLIHISEALDDDTYAATARTIFDNYILPRGSWNDGYFSLPWKDDGSGPNACTNSPGCLVASKLYERYNESSYLEAAKNIYAYQANEMRKLNNDGRVEEPPLTYTQGTFGEAARYLYHLTGQTEYKNMASKVLYYAISSSRCTDRGLLRNEGNSMDQSIFKAVLIPYLVNFVLDESMSATYKRPIINFLQKNANTLWSNLNLEAYPYTFCSYYWGEAFDEESTPSMGAMASGVSLMENTARMALALTTSANSINDVELEKNAPVQLFNTAGQPLKSMQRGLNIKKQKDGRIIKVIKR
ncbi:alpha-1,6-mannanase [Prevotella sp. E13-17]|uniref:glycoside hydrolase family 76 protein n=1 Tax=Prevotella sp. E13-17 TaxID=2913616 RepID=UPI001EDAA641|nr:glycoside hydrolase family 76 protein [Prevotella sp. E13-17]UKK51671.1 alpha-1,6-mannanase [Prevotella sp. E13-17]